MEITTKERPEKIRKLEKVTIETSTPKQVRFLSGDLAERVFKEYLRRANLNYDNPLSLVSYNPHYPTALDFNNGDKTLYGSNPFANVLINKILNEEGYRIINPKEMEKFLNSKKTNTRKNNYDDITHTDIALALRSAEGPNDYLAQRLISQIDNSDLKLPVMIPLTELDIEKDPFKHAEYGLLFNLKENAEIIYAPILNKSGKFRSKDMDDNIGLPYEVRGNRGTRIFESKRTNGLSRIYSLSGSHIFTGQIGLRYSPSDGRIAITEK